MAPSVDDLSAKKGHNKRKPDESANRVRTTLDKKPRSTTSQKVLAAWKSKKTKGRTTVKKPKSGTSKEAEICAVEQAENKELIPADAVLEDIPHDSAAASSLEPSADADPNCSLAIILPSKIAEAEAVLASIAAAVPHLHLLSITVVLNDFRIPRWTAFPNLQHLTIRPDAIFDCDIDFITETLPRLKTLRIFGPKGCIPEITGESLARLSQSCRSLEKLHLPLSLIRLAENDEDWWRSPFPFLSELVVNPLWLPNLKAGTIEESFRRHMPSFVACCPELQSFKTSCIFIGGETISDTKGELYRLFCNARDRLATT